MISAKKMSQKCNGFVTGYFDFAVDLKCCVELIDLGCFGGSKGVGVNMQASVATVLIIVMRLRIKL